MAAMPGMDMGDMKGMGGMDEKKGRKNDQDPDAIKH